MGENEVLPCDVAFSLFNPFSLTLFTVIQKIILLFCFLPLSNTVSLTFSH